MYVLFGFITITHAYHFYAYTTTSFGLLSFPTRKLEFPKQETAVSQRGNYQDTIMSGDDVIGAAS